MNPGKPILIYDGDCGFCRRWIDRWHDITADRIEYAPYQEAAPRFPGIAKEDFQSSVILVEPDGKITKAAEAVFRSLAMVPSRTWPLWLYTRVPGTKPAAEWAYRLVASHRGFFSGISRVLWGEDVRRASYFLSGSFFIRSLGLIYAIAFVSLGTQILGLVGSGGIVPAHDYLNMIQDRSGIERFWLLPTLAWLNSSDGFLQFLCWAGAAFSIFILLGVLPAFFLFLSWAFYLSLLGIGGPFLSFQWDILLLETGFLSIFLAPLNARVQLMSRGTSLGVIRFLLKLLLFKLLFLSGLVKLASHDAAWGGLTALRYHYETQPLTPWTAWYVHQMPAWFQTASCFLMFGVELVVPFFIFFPRRIRHLSARILIGFQLLIILTGNYTFFNLLTIALCMLLFDDSARPGKISQKLEKWNTLPSRKVLAWPRVITGTIAILVLLAALGVADFLRPFFIYNRYGLFAIMTTQRPEIVLEGSNDKKEWLPYEFKWKPGDLNRRPAFVAPHQPRLDWQMWFAALGNYRQNDWFIGLCRRLLEGSPDVLRLLEKDPFPDQPPRYIRAVVYRYHFTDPDERKRTGAWWRRELKGPYCPVLSLE